MIPLHDLGIRACAARIEKGELSPIDLVEHFLDRIDALDRSLHSYVRVTADHARAQARELDREARAGRYRGPLHGIPIALKDVIDTAGIPTEAGSAWCRGRIPAEDAGVWRRLREAGAILLGKLYTHEFANGGPCRLSDQPYDFAALNPWNPRRYTGGSSSGPASAVAAGLCMGAIGTDTGGSIRIPSSYCGIVGFKPSLRRVDTRGILPVSSTLDHCGPMAWTVDDAALLYAAMTGGDTPADPAARPGSPLAGRRIAYARAFGPQAQASPAVLRAVDEAAVQLARLGARVQEVRFEPLSLYTAVNCTIFLAEAHAFHERLLARDAGRYSAYTRARLMLGGCVAAAQYIRARQARRRLVRDYMQRMAGFDAVISVCTPATAPDAQHAADESQKFFFLRAPVPCAPFSLLGAPAISVCCGLDDEAMPIALHIASLRGRDATVLDIAAQYEAATQPSRRRPPGAAMP